MPKTIGQLVIAAIMVGLMTSRVNASTIAVSVAPQKFLAEAIVGDKVSVILMVPPGSSPHAYEVSPKQLIALGDAKAYFQIGEMFEHLLVPRLKSLNKNLEWIDARQGISLRHLESHEGHSHEGHSHDHPHDQVSASVDPHVWTAPLNMKTMSESMLRALCRLFAEHCDSFSVNQQLLALKLVALDAAIKDALRFKTSGQTFLVFHPAWGYFADAYGLRQVAIEHEGKEPGPRRLAQLIAFCKAQKVEVIFAQPQMSTKLANQLAEQIGARVEVVDPLALDYFDNMERLTAALAKALK